MTGRWVTKLVRDWIFLSSILLSFLLHATNVENFVAPTTLQPLFVLVPLASFVANWIVEIYAAK